MSCPLSAPYDSPENVSAGLAAARRHLQSLPHCHLLHLWAKGLSRCCKRVHSEEGIHELTSSSRCVAKFWQPSNVLARPSAQLLSGKSYRTRPACPVPLRSLASSLAPAPAEAAPLRNPRVEPPGEVLALAGSARYMPYPPVSFVRKMLSTRPWALRASEKVMRACARTPCERLKVTTRGHIDSLQQERCQHA